MPSQASCVSLSEQERALLTSAGSATQQHAAACFVRVRR
jgi:hypothetical protein